MFSIGSDPEFMLVGHVNDRVAYKSAIGVLPNQEHAICKRGHSFYYENVVAECGLKPATSKEEFLKNISSCLCTLAQIIWPLRITNKAAYYYPEEELLHPDALKAASKEDWCAYDMMLKEAPEEIIRETCFRTAGGHIHIGSKFLDNEENIPPVVRMLDLFLATPLVLIEKDKTGKERREVYGQAGRYRMTAYGLEYRTPSNYWICSPKAAEFVYDISQFVLEFVADNRHERFWAGDTCYGYDVDMLRQCIDECDRINAKKFMMIIDSVLPSNLQNQIEQLYSSAADLLDPYQGWRLL
jgi:hypothetical protein